MITMWGLKNCDTCRKARKWLEANEIEYRFRDVRDDELDKKTLARWTKVLGWEVLLNRRGTTWRKLSEADKSAVGEPWARGLMLEHPALVKRPVFEASGTILVGFTEEVRETLARLG